MLKLDYPTYVSNLQQTMPKKKAMEYAVGANFELFGLLEREILVQAGLKPEHYLIDVGCGSGRLALPMSEHLSKAGRYLGTDVVSDLLSYARSIVPKSNFRFEQTKGLTVPEADGLADMVCFFSVFTHLLHECSYAYLLEAKRVLKPGGKIVFSFLEFRMEHHWATFLANLATAGTAEGHLNQFMSRDAIEVWARRLGLQIESLTDGDKTRTKLPHPVTLDDKTVIQGEANMGQSICVLSKPLN